jgi:pimeloyl-ACP methyl ester carboxylesterase
MNEGPNTIVILHGWGHRKEYWSDFIRQCEGGGFRGEVIALDLPGFGREPLVSPEWGIPEYAQWTIEKIVSLKKENVILLGHSFGGRISGYIASERPAWLRGLILYGAPCLYRPKFSTKMKICVAKFLKKMGVRKTYSGNDELREADRVGMGAIFRKAVVVDESELLPKIIVPTLLVWGAGDTIEAPRRIAEEMHALISSSELVIMDGVGHNAHLENPTLFYGIVKKFIQKI